MYFQTYCIDRCFNKTDFFQATRNPKTPTLTYGEQILKNGSSLSLDEHSHMMYHHI